MRLVITVSMIGLYLSIVGTTIAQPAWTSPNRYKLSLSVDSRGMIRTNSPASVDIDFVQALTDQGGSGTFDEHTIETNKTLDEKSELYKWFDAQIAELIK